MVLLVPHKHKPENHREPIKVIREDGTIGSGIGPAQDGVEYSPSTTTALQGTAAVHMPYTLPDVVRSSPSTHLRCFTSYQVVPGVVLQVPDPTSAESCGN
jgi:hypothetical protein